MSLNVELAPATFTPRSRKSATSRPARQRLGRHQHDRPRRSWIFRPQRSPIKARNRVVQYVLNETPGIITTVQRFPGLTTTVHTSRRFRSRQIRGLPQLPGDGIQLIDGHPISIGSSGFYFHCCTSIRTCCRPSSWVRAPDRDAVWTSTMQVCGSVKLSDARADAGASSLRRLRHLNTYGGLSSAYTATVSPHNQRQARLCIRLLGRRAARPV